MASYGWYLDYPKLECKLKEKFEDACLNKPTSTDSNFRGGKRSHNAKKLRKTKDQLVGLINDKRNDQDLKLEEPTPNP